jgi:outer membrane protein OmpU
MNAYLSYSPQPDGSKNSNKGVSGTSVGKDIDGGGWDIALTHSGLVDGLNVFAGYGEIDQTSALGDRTTTIAGATYAIGSITIGYQWSKDNKVGVGAYYENQAYGIAFSVNDNLSISYGSHESDRNYDAGTGKTTLEGTSIQLAYTMGGASVKIAESDVDNQNYVAGTNREGRIVALTLAF